MEATRHREPACEECQNRRQGTWDSIDEAADEIPFF